MSAWPAHAAAATDNNPNMSAWPSHTAAPSGPYTPSPPGLYSPSQPIHDRPPSRGPFVPQRFHASPQPQQLAQPDMLHANSYPSYSPPPPPPPSYASPVYAPHPHQHPHALPHPHPHALPHPHPLATPHLPIHGLSVPPSPPPYQDHPPHLSPQHPPPSAYLPTPQQTPQHSYMGYQPEPPLHHHYTAPLAGPTPQRRLQTAEVKLEIRCSNLRNRDTCSKSDPACVVFLEDRSAALAHNSPYQPHDLGPDNVTTNEEDLRWKEWGRTEYIRDNLNPHFKTQVVVPYRFQELQNIRLGLWDIDSKRDNLSDHDFLGDARTTLGELVTARIWTNELSSSNPRDTRNRLGGKRNLGKITVIVHESQDGSNLLIKASFAAQKLPRKDWWLWSDPYFIVTQINSNAPTSRSQCFQSEVVKRNVNPTWRPFQFKAVIPKGGKKSDVILEVLVIDRDKRKVDDEIGMIRCSVSDLENASTLDLRLPPSQQRRRRRKKEKTCGALEVVAFSAMPLPSLVDYLQGGLKLHFSVAIDLTNSNGPPSNPESLHYCAHMYQGNHYVHALTAVANVLRVYTPSDDRFAAFGFGAELPGNPGVASPCFPLSLGQDPSCHGVHGILNAYTLAVQTVKFSGPTRFAPLINRVSDVAASRPNTQSDQNYDVLLILTDGVVSDYRATVDSIIAASSRSPLSIIIIGIGRNGFGKMKNLDSDDGLLKSVDGRRQAVRDICQFVAFRDYETAPPESLGAAVLQELPGNIVEYFVGACSPPIMPGQTRDVPPVHY